MGRREDARAERLREYERVSGARATVGEHVVDLHEARDCQAELGLVVVDGVAAGHDDARLAAPVGASGQDLAGHLQAQAVGKAQQVEREHGTPAHGPDVREGVGGRNLTKQVRVVHHGREEVRGPHKAATVPQVVDVGVVRGVEAHEQARVLKARQVGEHLREVARRELRRAPGRFHELREPDTRHVHVTPLSAHPAAGPCAIANVTVLPHERQRALGGPERADRGNGTSRLPTSWRRSPCRS